MKYIPRFKKILLVVPNYSSFYFPIAQALDKNRIKYLSFDNRKTNIQEKIVFALSKLFPKFRELGNYMINLRLENIVKRIKPDLVLVIKGENLLPKIIKNISQTIPIVNWFPDFLPDYAETEDWLKSYTALFIGDLYEVELYRKKGFPNIYYLPYAAPISPYKSDRKIYDVVFVGVYNLQREKIFCLLKELNFKIWGDSKWANSKLSKNYMGSWLSYYETLKVLNKSRIVVNFHQHRFYKNTMLNLRVYEAMVSGALLITDQRIDLPILFKIGKEVIVYKTAKELKEKVDYFLKHESKRRVIAKNGYKKVMAGHTYGHRLEEMFKIVSSTVS